MNFTATARPARPHAMALMAMALCACGGGSDQEASTSAETPTSVAAAPSAPAAPVTAPVTAPVVVTPTSTAYAKLTDESHVFSIDGTATVRFGDAASNLWVSKTVTGYGECTNDFFGSDPARGTRKTCQAPMNVIVPVAVATTSIVGQMPLVDTSEIPTPWVGSMKMQVAPTTERTVPRVSPGGEFRSWCTVAKVGFDDPIAFFGQPGKAHLHTFFGNNGVDASSTTESLRTTGGSTCRGGIANRSSYWVPTMIDTATGEPVLPDGMGPYYKTDDGDHVQALPPGLRMIAGDAASKLPQGPSRWKCIGGPNNENDKYGPGIPDCDAGAQMIQEVFFPECWDGVNLDSPNHKDHMHYLVNNRCPVTHPVLLPHITFNVFYTTPPNHAALKWRLSSDNYDTALPGGYSGHGDWFNAWDKSVSDAWHKGCLQAKVDCHSHLLGDGRMLY